MIMHHRDSLAIMFMRIKDIVMLGNEERGSLLTVKFYVILSQKVPLDILFNCWEYLHQYFHKNVNY